jgi:hypothetical protein
MKTAVIMKRKLFDGEISQHSKTNYFSGNDLIRVGNRYRASKDLSVMDLQKWLDRDNVKEFIHELELKLKVKAKIATRGRYATTWLHPYVFIDLALSIDPTLKIEVYSWIYDELVKYRNFSGDSYKRMSGALYENCSNKSKFQDGIKQTARMIRVACEVDGPFRDEEAWQRATLEQLELRDKIHDNIALLCDVLRDNNQAIRLGIAKSIESHKKKGGIMT